MSHPTNTPDKSPATQGDQPDAGAIKKPQRTDNDMQSDTSRGAEPAIRRTSRGR